MEKPSTFINFILHVFLELLQRYCKLVVFGTLDLSDYVHPTWYYHFLENICVYFYVSRQKLNLIPQRQANLFWLFWAWLVTLNQNDSITLHKTSMFTDIKIYFIIHFFLTILHFKESCNLIDWQSFGPFLKTRNFARYVGEISIKIFFFILDYFQSKLTWQNFSKFLRLFWARFVQIWAKMIFLEKTALSASQYSNYLPMCQKS